MLKNRKESLMAIVGILFVGILSLSKVIDRQVGMMLAIVIFSLSEVMTCYNLKKKDENWKKEATYGAMMILLIVALLYF